MLKTFMHLNLGVTLEEACIFWNNYCKQCLTDVYGGKKPYRSFLAFQKQCEV